MRRIAASLLLPQVKPSKSVDMIRGHYIYGAVKHMVDTFQGPHRSFPRVVLIEYPRKGLWTMGLVAAERGDTLHLTPSPSVLTVYIPTTPNPTSGVLVMVAA